MVEVTIGDLLQENVVNASKTIFENSGGFTKRDDALAIAALVNGSLIELISSEADLPPVVDGFHQLEQNKNYYFIEAGAYANPILFPAGYIGSIKATFLSADSIEYTGIGAFFNTLNKDGAIMDFSDAGGGAITVETTVTHGLFNGQFVNITGTAEPTYNQQRLVISNVTATTFDVQIPFQGPAMGSFNTGFDLVEIKEIDFSNGGSADLFDVTSSQNIISVFSCIALTAVGFLNPGIIRKTINAGFDTSILGFILNGMIFEDCPVVSIVRSLFLDLAGISQVDGLTIQGGLTERVIVDNCDFQMSEVSQHPVRIDPSIPAISSITIQSSSDNLVAADYFDTSTGGLDQTDPRVITLNNGTRANSMSLAEARSFGILVVDGSGSGLVPIVDETPAPGDWVEDPSTEEFTIDTTTGLVTYNGIRPISVKIEYSLLAQRTTGGGDQVVSFTLGINGLSQSKTVRTVTINTSGFIPVSYAGGNFEINPGDTFQLFVDVSLISNNVDADNAIMLITRN